MFLSDSTKTPEMNELDIELSKKSKIIEIGSVEKKSYRFSKLEVFRKNPKIPGFSYSEIEILLQKLSHIFKILKIVKKFF